ncbi:hypothetical protein HMPREF1345_02565 [Enterococcus faecium TX1337RF]|nr:hypothetical protein HMPREF1345_02565 [Enterococcus faecium TX1337RF]
MKQKRRKIKNKKSRKDRGISVFRFFYFFIKSQALLVFIIIF